MNKRNIAITLELIPIISALISFILFRVEYNSEIFVVITKAAILLALMGFIFFFIGRKLDKEDQMVKILGILDWLSTIYVIVVYIVAIFNFGA